MAIPLIALMGDNFNPAANFIQGREAGQRNRLLELQQQELSDPNSTRNQLQQQQLAAGQQQLDQGKLQMLSQGADLVYRAFGDADRVDDATLNQRYQLIRPQLEPLLKQVGGQAPDQIDRQFALESLQEFAPFRPQKEPKLNTELEKLMAARDRLPQGHPDRQALDMAIANKSAPKQGITISPDGTIQIGGSSQGLDKTVNRESQQAIISAGQSLDRLKAIKENYDRNFLTYQGKVGNFLSSVKSKAGADLSDEERSALRQRRRFTQGVNAEFNAYRKLITGAAASVQELESLKKAMISEDLSPDEFEAAFNEYATELSRTIRIRNKLMREGLQPGTKQFGERLDGLFLRGDDDDVNARGAELEQQGLGTDEILDILEQEGYGY